MDITENIKYYTPTIEEFHIGFEFEQKEYFGEPGWLWNQKEFHSFYLLKDSIEDNKIRVKYLDHDDIISLGWVKSSSHYPNNPEMTDYDLDHKTIAFNRNDHTIYIDCGENNGINFHIKNKSELQRLMKQLGI